MRTHLNAGTQFVQLRRDQGLQPLDGFALAGIVLDLVLQIFHVLAHLSRSRPVEFQAAVLSRENVSSLPDFSLIDIDTNRLQLLDYKQSVNDPLPVLLVSRTSLQKESVAMPMRRTSAPAATALLDQVIFYRRQPLSVVSSASGRVFMNRHGGLR